MVSSSGLSQYRLTHPEANSTAVNSNTLGNEVTLPSHYVRNLLDLLQSRGGNVEAVLAKAGLPPEGPNQINATLSWQQFHAVIQLCCNEINEPALGLYLGSQLTINTHGMLGLAAISSVNMHEALQLICKYTATRSPLLTLSMRQNQQQVHLTLEELHPLADIRQFVVETFAVTLHATLDFVTGHKYSLRQVQFAFAEPGYSALYQAFFPCPVRFAQPQHRFIFDAADLAIPCPWADRQVQNQLSAQCEQELQRWQQSQSIAGLIRLMLGRTKGRVPCIEKIAAEFAMSSRTLRRRLDNEQTSYHQLITDWRQQMATHYLLTTALPVQQIGFLLGYADPANFGRAFRRENGVSPQQFRAKQQTKCTVDLEK
ncbi:AraC family transcriptional regulator [Rheinheimera baltica]|uniref:AraC family transcriptional regulator n=1 Tax=Rheinheimera baltica TaxID=67576 RepID=UPI00273F3DDE|nr:AraC family transcriptional regulator [Rheinheimera baltica]MDP5149512.1 AraC family transcriptional regulator [Rheinheimera baltica]